MGSEIHLLDDLPQIDIGDTLDAARILPAAEQLAVMFQHAAQPDACPEPLAVGLFGGLGQGKTSALRLAQAIYADRLHGKLSHFFLFDAAQHKSRALEFDLDRLLAALKPRGRVHWLLVGVTGGLLLTLFIVFNDAPLSAVELAQKIADKFHVTPWVASLLLAFIGLNAKRLYVLKRELERTSAFSGLPGLTTLMRKWLWPAKTHWLVIDNLDRASIAQQRAVLRAVYKARGLMQMHTVICMDTTAILKSAPNPEAPLELLRKVVTTELHLPARMPVDALRTATALSQALTTLNPQIRGLESINSPEVVSALARVALLTESNSARAIKHLLNDTLMSCATARSPEHTDAVVNQVGAPVHPIRLDQWFSVLRLQGLWTLAPTLRSSAWLVRDAFDDNSSTALAVLVGQARAMGCSARQTSKIERYVQQTRHLRPFDGDVAMALAGTRSKLRSANYQQETALPKFATGSTDACPYVVNDAMLDAMRRAMTIGVITDESLQRDVQRSAVNDTALWITAFDLFVLEARDNVRLAAVAVEVHQYLARDTNSLRKIHAQSHVELVCASDQSCAESLGAREFSRWLQTHVDNAANESLAADVQEASLSAAIALITLLPIEWIAPSTALEFACLATTRQDRVLYRWVSQVCAASGALRKTRASKTKSAKTIDVFVANAVINRLDLLYAERWPSIAPSATLIVLCGALTSWSQFEAKYLVSEQLIPVGIASLFFRNLAMDRLINEQSKEALRLLAKLLHEEADFAPSVVLTDLSICNTNLTLKRWIRIFGSGENPAQLAMKNNAAAAGGVTPSRFSKLLDVSTIRWDERFAQLLLALMAGDERAKAMAKKLFPYSGPPHDDRRAALGLIRRLPQFQRGTKV